VEAYIGRAKFSLLFWHHRSQNIEKIPSIPVLLLGLKDGMAECIERTEGAWSSKFFVRSKLTKVPSKVSYIYTFEGIVYILKTLINNIIPSFVMRPIH
jgi:hypothetical protein